MNLTTSLHKERLITLKFIISLTSHRVFKTTSQNDRMSLSKAPRLNTNPESDSFCSLPKVLHECYLWYLDFLDLRALHGTCREMAALLIIPPDKWCKFQALWIGKATGKYYFTMTFIATAQPGPIIVKNEWLHMLYMLQPQRCTKCSRLFSVEYRDASIRKRRVRRALQLEAVCDLCYQELLCETRSTSLIFPIASSPALKCYKSKRVHYYRVDELKKFVAKHGNPAFFQ